MDNIHARRFLFSDAIRRTSETPERFSVYDIMNQILGHKNNPRTALRRLKDTHKDLISSKFEHYKFPGKKNSPVTDIATAWNVTKWVIGGSKISLDAKRKILGELDYYPVRKFTETELHTNVRLALAHVDIRFQYAVEQYRIDMFLPRYNIAVECDEYDHCHYSSTAETERLEVISQALKCRWIRYNPYSSDFNIFNLINQLFIAMGSQ